jgi:cell pole-organizing protein PopZ
MTQPAKSQEPSMEEILASIRRIIADDDAGRIAKRTSDAPSAREAAEAHDAFGQPAEPPRPSFFAPPEPSIPETPAETPADSAATSAAEEDHASEILDLTESMTARLFSEPERAPAQSPAPDATSEFREPEPAPQFHEPEPEPVPQFEEPEPEPEPVSQFQEPEPAPQFHMIEDYSDASVDAAAKQAAMPRPSEQSVPFVAPPRERRGAGERGTLLSSATSAAVDSAFNALAHTVLVQNARTLEDLVREMLRPMLKTWLDDNLPGLVERLVRAEIERVARGR